MAICRTKRDFHMRRWYPPAAARPTWEKARDTIGNETQCRKPSALTASSAAGTCDICLPSVLYTVYICLHAGSSRRIVARRLGSPHCRFPVQVCCCRLLLVHATFCSSPKGVRVNITSLHNVCEQKHHSDYALSCHWFRVSDSAACFGLSSHLRSVRLRSSLP